MLTISARPGTTHIQVSNDGGFLGAQWEPYASRKNWQIIPYDNAIIPRTVYVRFRNNNGSISSNYSDDIVLDVKPPEGDIQIKSVVDSNTYSLQLRATDDMSGVEEMRVSSRPNFDGASWEPFTAVRTWDFNESRTVYAQFRDNAGNTSQVYVASIVNQQQVFLPLTRN
jgi:hypothetical protein